MPSSATAKIELGHRRSKKFAAVWGGLVVFVFAVASGLWLWSHPAQTRELRVGSRTYGLELAESAAAQQRGLSGRPAIAAGDGMLFAFPATAHQCMWMKNMQFSIDIIWLDTEKRVVHTESNMAPSTYPKAFCHRARYVIELRAGQAAAASIEQGQKLTF